MLVGRFLAGIAALIWDPATGHYLLLRRSGHRDYGARAWECVTGRVDQGEGFLQALHREVKEEVNLEIQVEFLLATTHFYRGVPSPETELLGVMFGCTVKNPDDFRMSDEHSAYRWASAQEVDALLPEGHWLRRLIQRAETLKQHSPAELRAILQEQLVEI